MPKDETNPPDSAYTGRWVARLQGRIVGQGGTPEAAWLAAKGSRSKEKPDISYMHDPSPLDLPEVVTRMPELAPGQEMHLVGGAVRDALLRKKSHDFDIVVARDAIGTARRIAGSLGADFYVLDQDFDAARIILPGRSDQRDVLDFTSHRGAGILADLAARDFTVNAIALDLRDRTTLDPLGGASDLKRKMIRACSTTSIADDPIRILRAVRLAAALDFTIEAGTRTAMRESAGLLADSSMERQRDEFFRILSGKRADASLRALDMLGVVSHILPELTGMKGATQPAPHVHDVWEHTLAVVHYLEELYSLLIDGEVGTGNGVHTSLLMLGLGRYREEMQGHFSRAVNQDRSMRALLQFAALYHDCGKPAARTTADTGQTHFYGHEQKSSQIAVERATKWNLSNQEAEALRTIVGNHMRFFFLASRQEAEGERPSRRAIYRFFRDAKGFGPELVLLGLADVRGTRGGDLNEGAWSNWVDTARTLLENLWEKPDEAVTPPRLVDGHDLMRALDVEPGPLIGELLEIIREAQATGAVSSREAALALARESLAKTRL